MCEPVSLKSHDYELSLTATGVCDMGEVHTVRSSQGCNTFADAFKATREFWTTHKGKTITVSLNIAPHAADHLKARA